MNFFDSLLLSASGLFDFDLTFPGEILLFSLFSILITKLFLAPISSQLTERSEFLNFTLKKSMILFTKGYEKLDTTVDLLTQEIEEMNRQLKLVKEYTFEKFDNEILFCQKENGKILSKLKGDLSIRSAFLLSSLINEMNLTVEKFFEKKFRSI
jgi:hypothetical protein